MQVDITYCGQEVTVTAEPTSVLPADPSTGSPREAADIRVRWPTGAELLNREYDAIATGEWHELQQSVADAIARGEY